MTNEERQNILDRMTTEFSAQRLAGKKQREAKEQVQWEEMCRHMADKMQSGLTDTTDSRFANCEFYCQSCCPAMETMTVEMFYTPKNEVNTYRCLQCGAYRTEEPRFDYFQPSDLITMDG